ncbi:right-handed parallel beta-helix repeat-containing protein [Candidatus Sumerlaeota bacterium]|nr:right-handed parallel beta-helix repeat-containing protein [Candidatus Sumerlaeota bacterium]
MKKVTVFSALILMLSMSLSAAPVVVDNTGGGDFTTIQAAIDDAGAPTEILVRNTGTPYDESILITRSLSLRGEDPGSRPIVMLRALASQPLPTATAGDGMYIGANGIDVTVADLILIPSGTSTVADSMITGGIETADDSFNVRLHNLLVTANDGSNQPLATSVWDTPDFGGAGVVNMPSDGIYLMARGTFSGGADGIINLTLTDVIVNGAGGTTAGTHDGAVLYAGVGGTGYMSGCGFSNSQRYGIQMSDEATWTITGSQGRPSMIVYHNESWGCRFFGAGSFDVDHAYFIDNDPTDDGQGGFTTDPDTVLAFSIRDSVSAENGGVGWYTATYAAAGPETYTATNCTFHNNAAAAPSNQDQVIIDSQPDDDLKVVFTDCLFSGAGTDGVWNVSSAGVTLNNCGAPTTGPDALTNVIDPAGTVTEVDTLNDDPAYYTTSSVGLPRNMLAPTAAAHMTASASGSYLRGGFSVATGNVVPTPDGDLSEWGAVDPITYQTVQTGYGNNSDADAVTANGSELDAILITNSPDALVIGLPGVLESNGNAIHILIDTDPLASTPAGVTTLPDPLNQTANELRAFAGMDGDTLPFAADCAVVFENGGFGAFANFITLTGPSTVAGEDLGDGGSGGSTSGLVDFSTTSARDIQIGYNASNIDGVSGGSGANDPILYDPLSVDTGYEVSIPLSDIGGLSDGDLIQVVAYVTSWDGWISNQFMPSLSAPSANLDGGGTAQDLTAQGVTNVATYQIGPGQTPVQSYEIYR